MHARLARRAPGHGQQQRPVCPSAAGAAGGKADAPGLGRRRLERGARGAVAQRPHAHGAVEGAGGGKLARGVDRHGHDAEGLAGVGVRERDARGVGGGREVAGVAARAAGRGGHVPRAHRLVDAAREQAVVVVRRRLGCGAGHPREGPHALVVRRDLVERGGADHGCLFLCLAGGGRRACLLFCFCASFVPARRGGRARASVYWIKGRSVGSPGRARGTRRARGKSGRARR